MANHPNPCYKCKHYSYPFCTHTSASYTIDNGIEKPITVLYLCTQIRDRFRFDKPAVGCGLFEMSLWWQIKTAIIKWFGRGE